MRKLVFVLTVVVSVTMINSFAYADEYYYSIKIPPITWLAQK